MRFSCSCRRHKERGGERKRSNESDREGIEREREKEGEIVRGTEREREGDRRRGRGDVRGSVGGVGLKNGGADE